MKEPKLILEGPADSGKTSWVAPFEGKKYLIIINPLITMCPSLVAGFG